MDRVWMFDMNGDDFSFRETEWQPNVVDYQVTDE
jgi:hypothetical protein